MRVQGLFDRQLSVANIGLEKFYMDMQQQNLPSVHLDWKPPAGGNTKIIEILGKLGQATDQANETVFQRINQGDPQLIDIKYAHEVLPLDAYTIGHAGPPLSWEEMCGPLQGAVLGAVIYEGLAKTLEEAESLVLNGKIKFVSNHSLGAVGPMTGMVTASMPLYEIKNQTFGNIAYSTFNEGLGKVLRFGANGPEVIQRLRWLEKTLAPALKSAITQSGPIMLKNIIAKALAMGDEMHQRNIAASALFLREIIPHIAATTAESAVLAEICRFLSSNEQLFLNLAMAACKAVMDPVKNIPHSSVVTAMSRNGTRFGIKISAMGDRWFEAPVLMPKGLYFPGYSEQDANPDMGDSAICETFGIGGMAMGAAPAVVRFVGAASVAQAREYTDSMKKIAWGESPNYLMPTMDFSGIPTAIDLRKVVECNTAPVINTGIAHKQPGIGQIGAGIVNAPIDCFTQALLAFAEHEGVEA